MNQLSHIDNEGNAQMVDVSSKAPTLRRAIVEGWITLKAVHLEAMENLPKGDLYSVAQIAGIQGGKKCSELIPLCHPIALTHIDVQVRLVSERLRITAETRTTDRTGVEMEAYAAVAVAGITCIDMLKGVDPDLELTGVRLVLKSGGKVNWKRE